MSFQRTAAGVTTWTVEEDSNIVGMNNSGSVVMSYDSADTVANVLTTPAANRITEGIIIGSNSANYKGPMMIPVLKGQVIFVSVSAAGTFTIYLDDFKTLN